MARGNNAGNLLSKLVIYVKGCKLSMNRFKCMPVCAFSHVFSSTCSATLKPFKSKLNRVDGEAISALLNNYLNNNSVKKGENLLGNCGYNRHFDISETNKI